MNATVTLEIVDDIKIVVPDSLDLITPYVLREQNDWFEDEIKFLRRLLQPGQTVIDIGANYGLYTLSIAHTVGGAGRVWAFEPASTTAALLAQSIVANGYSHVELVQSALSSAEGTAQLSMNNHSELNALVHDERDGQPTEAVRVATLDGCAEEFGWSGIDFVKIDAEGEEANVLKGGTRFFRENSPLVQYEIKVDKGIDLGLVQAFSDIGYQSYRLVPGHDLLVPFCSDRFTDIYMLNLFACKSDRAAKLAGDDWLVERSPEPDASNDLPREISRDVLKGGAYDWRNSLVNLPYGKMLRAEWERNIARDSGDGSAVEEILALHALSRDTSRSATERFFALDCSFRRIQRLAETSSTHPHLASLARIARDFGARSIAINALRALWSSFMQEKRVILDEPFLPASPRFDEIEPGDALGDWMIIGVAEELERSVAFSSFYPGRAAQKGLEIICKSNLAGPEMRRRLQLVRERFGND